ncbi:MAG: hypothetical protein ABSB74_19665 [Tepidisphaeraceae bacterium]
MKKVSEMSAIELRRAILTEGPNPWQIVRLDETGELVGELPEVISECPESVPN